MSIDQPDLFDALRRVEEHADDDWKAAAAVALQQLAATGREFTADDVRDAIPSHITTHEMRALGPVMKAGVRRGLIAAVGYTTKGRAEAHGRAQAPVSGDLMTDDHTPAICDWPDCELEAYQSGGWG